MKFIKRYIEEKYFLQTNGRVTLQHICDDAGLDGVKVFINNVKTGLFISQAEYDEWVESMFDEIKSKNEDKLTYKVAPRFKAGDWAVYNNTNVYQVKKIEYIINMIPRYELENIDGDKFSIPFTSDYNLRNWNIQDAKDGDVLVTTNKNLFIFKDIKGAAIYDYCGLFFGEFKSVSNCVNGTISVRLPNDYLPATKEQRDILFAKMKESGYEWDANKKELKKIEQKPLEQSEDKKMRRCISDVVRKYGAEFTSGTVTKETMLAWLEKQGESIDKEKVKIGARKDLALSIINYLDDNRVEGCMDLSSMECEDIEDACINSKWTKLYNYMKKKLEKQDEPKDYNSIDPRFGRPIDTASKFKVGDWVVSPIYGTARIIGIEVNNSEYLLEYTDGTQQYISIDYVNYGYDKWNIQMAKDGDVLVSPRQIGCEKEEDIFIFKCIGNRDYVYDCIEYYCNIDEGEFFVNKTSYMGTISSPLYPATHEQREFLFKKMKKAGYKWDDEKKQILRIDNYRNTIEK